MPSILKVRVLGARNLPIMDVRTELTDAYVEVRFADFEVRRTATARRTLNPVWNEDFRFEVGDDSMIQNEPLELRIVDSDVITSDDIIGVVFIDLNPLLTSAWDEGVASASSQGRDGSLASPYGAARSLAAMAPNSGGTAGQINGWVPIVDTLLGLRGEINIQIRLQFFGDSNPFRDSSAGVQFFCTPSLVSCVPAMNAAHLGGQASGLDEGVARGETNLNANELNRSEVLSSGDNRQTPQHISAPGGYYYRIVKVLGFVELLDWDDDPEYHWTDTFRTPRFSNESRQLLLFRLSGHIRRQLGKKVAALGGNAVIGFRQYLDLEKSERVITYRAEGTAVLLAAPDLAQSLSLPEPNPSRPADVADALVQQNSSREEAAGQGSGAPEGVEGRTRMGHSRTRSSLGPGTNSSGIALDSIPKGNDDSNDLPENTKGHGETNPGNSSQPGSVESDQCHDLARASAPTNNLPAHQRQHQQSVVKTYDPGELQSVQRTVIGQRLRNFSTEQKLVTATTFPAGWVTSIGGLVTARGVKIIDMDDDEDEVRDAWWHELRDEIESHAEALGCSYVVGYTETTTIDDDLYILTACGTAANLDVERISSLGYDEDENSGAMASTDVGNEQNRPWSGLDSPVDDTASVVSQLGNGGIHRQSSTTGGDSIVRERSRMSMSAAEPKNLRPKRHRKPCSICHISYSRHGTPFPMSYTKCGRCRRGYVPEVIIASMEPPAELETLPKTVLIEAHVCRQKKRAERELNAEIVSDALPFVQYDIHRQLIYKLKIYGMNAIFGLKLQLAVSDSLIVATALGTGMFIKALPLASPLKIARNLGVVDEEDRKLLEIQQKIVELSEANRKDIEAELQKELKLSAINRATINRNATNLENNQGISEDAGRIITLGEDGATYDGTLDSDSDSVDSENEFGERRRRLSLDSGDSDQREVRPMPLVQSSVIVQIDDDADEDLMAVLLDQRFGLSFQLLSTGSLPRPNSDLKVAQNANLQLVVAVRQDTITAASHHPNRQLAALFRGLYEELEFRLSYFHPCILIGIEHDLQVIRDNEVWIRLVASAVGEVIHLPESRLAQRTVLSAASLSKSLPPTPPEATREAAPQQSPPSSKDATEGSLSGDKQQDRAWDRVNIDSVVDYALVGVRIPENISHTAQQFGGFAIRFVDVTPLAQIPGCTVMKYLGVISFHFVKESYLDYDEVDLTKGMGGFVHSFFDDVLAVVRAHAAALGGNAVLAFRIDQAVFNENVKGTGYAVVTCSGDVVQTLPSEELLRHGAVGGLELGFTGMTSGDQHPLNWAMDLRMDFAL